MVMSTGMPFEDLIFSTGMRVPEGARGEPNTKRGLSPEGRWRLKKAGARVGRREIVVNSRQPAVALCPCS
eukprot:22982-Pleurochrysis_carterae.AAC.4